MLLNLPLNPDLFKTTHWARKYGLKLEVALKWRDIYVENISGVTDGQS